MRGGHALGSEVHPLGAVGGAPLPTVSPKIKSGIELGEDDMQNTWGGGGERGGGADTSGVHMGPPDTKSILLDKHTGSIYTRMFG